MECLTSHLWPLNIVERTKMAPFYIPCLIIFSVVRVGCGDSGNWVCKADKNRNGDRIQFSMNTKIGEIGAANKACE